MSWIVAFVIAGLALVLGIQLSALLSARAARGRHVDGLSGPLAQAVATGRNTLVYFHSPGCAACRVQTPVIEKLQRDNPNVFSINIAEDLATAKAFGVRGTPSTVLVRDGIVRVFLLGSQPEARLRSLLQP